MRDRRTDSISIAVDFLYKSGTPGRLALLSGTANRHRVIVIIIIIDASSGLSVVAKA